MDLSRIYQAIFIVLLNPQFLLYHILNFYFFGFSCSVRTVINFIVIMFCNYQNNKLAYIVALFIYFNNMNRLSHFVVDNWILIALPCSLINERNKGRFFIGLIIFASFAYVKDQYNLLHLIYFWLNCDVFLLIEYSHKSFHTDFIIYALLIVAVLLSKISIRTDKYIKVYRKGISQKFNHSGWDAIVRNKEKLLELIIGLYLYRASNISIWILVYQIISVFVRCEMQESERRKNFPEGYSLYCRKVPHKIIPFVY